MHYKTPQCGFPIEVPELLQDHATAELMAQWLIRFTAEQPLRRAMISGFEQVRSMLSPPEDGRNPARVVLDCLER